MVLAYIGDAVYELLSRDYVVENGVKRIRDIHKQTVGLVRAHHQALVLRSVQALLTEKEREVVRRGRNVKSHVPHHASPREYRSSTGLEALFGYWYLSGQKERMEELFAAMMNCKEEESVGENP